MSINFRRPLQLIRRFPWPTALTKIVCEGARAVFDHNGFLLNANEAVGELVDTATANDFEGYWKNEQATDARTRNGYIWMGDLAYRDEQDFFYFVGRDSDRIRVDGENIACAQIEQVLHRHPKVMLAAVYPVPDESKKTIYKVIIANFVSLEDGSGIVHIAPAFGAEDM